MSPLVAWLITAAVPFCLLAGILSTEGAARDEASATDGPQGVPPDYREIIARSILMKTDLKKFVALKLLDRAYLLGARAVGPSRARV